MEVDEYRKLAEAEDGMWYFHAVHGHVWRALRRALPATGSAELLDAGCGTGGLITRMNARRPDWRWTGVDLSPVACAWARTRGDFAVQEASLTALPMEAASFDAVTSVDVLYHIEDDGAALRELWRVLRPGGVLVLNVPAYPWLWSYHDVAVHSVRRYGRREVADKLRAAGFEGIQTTHWNMIPLPLVVVRRKLLPPSKHGSDVEVQAPWIEAVFRGIMRVEGAWLDQGWALPAGSSIFALARKPHRTDET